MSNSGENPLFAIKHLTQLQQILRKHKAPYDQNKLYREAQTLLDDSKMEIGLQKDKQIRAIRQSYQKSLNDIEQLKRQHENETKLTLEGYQAQIQDYNRQIFELNEQIKQKMETPKQDKEIQDLTTTLGKTIDEKKRIQNLTKNLLTQNHRFIQDLINQQQNVSNMHQELTQKISANLMYQPMQIDRFYSSQLKPKLFKWKAMKRPATTR